MCVLPQKPEEAAEESRFIGTCIVVMLLVLVALFAGCATKPLDPCPDAEATIVRSRELGLMYAFTPEALQQWHDAIRAEARGQCEWKKGEPA